MCGIVGMISDGKPVSGDIIRSLVAQVNRGKQSSGIISSYKNGGGADFDIRAEGAASDVFKGLNLEEIDQEIGIGHVRYATAGRNLTRDAQPRYVPKPGMVMAHNGQIANYMALRERLEQKRDYKFRTECDVEALLYAFAQNLIDRKQYEAKNIDEYVQEKLFPALRDTMDPQGTFSSIGAYSTVTLLDKRGLLAFKDPNGIRPLTFAKRESDAGLEYVFASETVAIPTWFGFSDHEEMKPGEAIFIDHDMNVYRQEILNHGQKTCIFEAIYFMLAHSRFNGRIVEDIRYDLGIALAMEYRELRDRVDLIVDIPKTPIPTAQALANTWNKQYGGILSNANMRTFQAEEQSQRELDARAKFTYNEDRFRGKRVGVVDDSVVRGTNSKQVIEILYELGAEEVHFFSTFPPYVGICPGGVDVAAENELLIKENTPYNIDVAREKIRATTLNYLSLGNMLDCLGLDESRVCLGCTREQYPFDMTDYKRFKALRDEQRAAVACRVPHS
ncbi:hypothetical protein HN695_02970 [Candidatus Woesearchaeota archaeon]|jgi:amidophosphoribosyltransferase|nr:hypothetical protein [Candidatus Woesearchaeota archaeon]MBT5271739.1 hypothetical protein [Candidatus Woesearchaeota archaeon]MBT6337397.1 hypothetical protein [Candidatus Woesearchaeota archaeon]MBT7927273.1 hypothetical protein [Candidatus Woesearchaeota archaeon]